MTDKDDRIFIVSGRVAVKTHSTPKPQPNICWNVLTHNTGLFIKLIATISLTKVPIIVSQFPIEYVIYLIISQDDLKNYKLNFHIF